ncbi:GTPase EngC [Pseudodesulfovibrio mercurii]|uniref:Small ribosomal subunit biogenesis GTPase RsgA n=1 Tax=Pseudodesulfovibrio mercurii TaxID=641491 RepID=F0JJF8_9BACT|nr:ribosome small subunit-dependent GTPase A [Pseudodesulfovibrio mercurii]EGB16057.1 GTPase EngC [Pseudodesulfovibrio mercurii]
MKTPIHAAHGCEATDRLRRLGWNEHFDGLMTNPGFDPDRVARVVSAQRDLFLVADGRAEWICTPSGKLRRARREDYPVTGDWVIVDESVVQRVLPRRNTLRRGEAGSRGKQDGAAPREQPIAANLDTVLIVSGLDRDYNPRRLERYLALVYNCGMTPVIVLTKADLLDCPDAFRAEAEAVAPGVPVVLTSTVDGSGAEGLHGYLGPGRTAAMIGSSGAGKSSLANMLLGHDVRATAAVSRSVGKGRHTTTSRELIAMPQGGLLMDNPGIREIAFAGDGAGLDAAFADILELAESCRFADCTHRHEPGCAVLRAVDTGILPPERLDNYRKMQREMDYVRARSEKSADYVEKERWRDRAMEIRRITKRGKR